ncbi:MAG: iron-sulfur cluster assembly protein [Bacteroidales bacterium]|nr:iron-sulfur cluster assembly protein [Bacteroidales bacterium]
MKDKNQLAIEIINVLKTIYDPEIPVNIYDLGIIYDISIDDSLNVTITMTLTSPSCPMADNMLKEINEKIKAIQGVNNVQINIVFEPQWNKDMISDEAKLQLGLL